MIDIQNEKDTREVPLKKVGVRGVEYPVHVLDKVNKINQLEVFDNYVVLYYDPDGKIYKENKAMENHKFAMPSDVARR